MLESLGCLNRVPSDYQKMAQLLTIFTFPAVQAQACKHGAMMSKGVSMYGLQPYSRLDYSARVRGCIAHRHSLSNMNSVIAGVAMTAEREWVVMRDHRTEQHSTAQHSQSKATAQCSIAQPSHSTAQHSRRCTPLSPLSRISQILKGTRLARSVMLLLIALQSAFCSKGSAVGSLGTKCRPQQV